MSSDSNNNKENKSENNNNNEEKEQNITKPMKNIDIKNLPSYEYFQKTVQKEIQLGLMNVSKLKPSDPIKYLGEFLIEKSKSYKS